MKFSTDELMPFFEVRTGMSKHLDDVVQAGKEIVITRHGKPEGALISAAQFYRFREVDQLVLQLLEVLKRRTQTEPLTLYSQINEITSQLESLSRCGKNGDGV